MNRSLILFILAFNGLTSYAQYMSGPSQSNYSGIAGVHYNPAYLADNRFKLNVNIFSLNVYTQNNYINLKTPYKQIQVINGKLDSSFLDSNGVALFNNSMMEQNDNGKRKYMFFSTDIIGPSAMINLKDKSGFAFSFRLRATAYLANMDNGLMNFFFLSGFDSTGETYFSKDNYQKHTSRTGSKYKAGGGVNMFQQYTASYSRVLKDGDKHFFSGGVSLSYLKGMGAAFIRLNEFNYKQPAEDSVDIKGVDLEYGYINPSFFNRKPPPSPFNYFEGNKLGSGASMDIGFSYENRIKKEKYVFELDKNMFEDRSMIKYVYRLGVSLVDWGAVNYNNSKYVTHVKASGDTSIPLKFSRLNGGKQFKTVEEVDSFINSLFPQLDSTTTFKAKLPTALHFQADVNLGKGFFAGGQYTQSVRSRSKEGIKARNVLILSARYETKIFESSMFFSFGNFYKKMQVGLYVRSGPFFIGSDNLGGLMGTKSTNGMSIYTGFTVPITYKSLKDNDGDKISNKFDKCPDVKGSFKAEGCPDKDNDGVPDKEDECPKEPGRKTTKGCPDDDRDKIWGRADKCPALAGKKENAGCPDTDGDGLFDHKDNCPEVAGPKTNAGCPVKEEPKAPEPKKVEPKKVEPKKEELDFAKFYYYPVIGVFGIKTNAEKFSKTFTDKTSVKSSLYYNEAKKLYYVTTGKLESKEAAEKVIETLDRPEINSMINGKVWMFPEQR